ncbi:AAA family ATPase [Leptolyngbya sp. FACHB-17]|nr:AAA family ATPase [Leptolyngbya sp. FACHB-17]MBD2082869.1 AAA family ATPase [Leptolyngbya sp. FACHB-17]
MRSEPFLDNWTYLKVEFNWLERLLLTAVAKQRKDVKTIERVSQTKADRVTSHWWKGLISLDEAIASDSPVERRKSAPTPTYQQQLDARIQASGQHGIGLALPMLCDRLNLTTFEKNVVLIALAPEVHRRYAQLYGYLQSGHDVAERPTIDLVLRLLCRTDAEWRTVRSSLSDSSRLMRSGLIEVEENDRSSFLSRSIKLSDEGVNFLLSEPAELAELEELIAAQMPALIAMTRSRRSVNLVLPEAVQAQLAQVCDRIRFAPQLQAWGFTASTGVTALLIGASGTGKTIAAQSIAQKLALSLTEIDLAIVDDSIELIEELIDQAPEFVLIKSAERWLKRSAPIAQVIQLIEARSGLTCFSVRHRLAIPTALRSRIHFTIEFSKPDAAARVQLWKQAFPEVTPISEIDWQTLAKKHSLTGGEIQKIAEISAIEALSQDASEIELHHVLKAISRLSQ